MTSSPVGPDPIPREKLRVVKHELHRPALAELASLLEKGLKKNFAKVQVQVKKCPDLSEKPFGLAAAGICGNAKLLDLGGPHFLTPTPQKDKIYDMIDLAFLSDSGDGKALFIGAGAGPWPYVDQNCEAMPNVLMEDGLVTEQRTTISYTVDEGKGMKLARMPKDNTRMALMGNYFVSEGRNDDQVLEIKCQTRTGKENFVTCMRNILRAEYGKSNGNPVVALGGTFLVNKGQVKIHVMPDFSPCPLNTDEEVGEWLKYFRVEAPFVFLSEFVSHDPGWKLRVEHSHGYGVDEGNEDQGGHYHYDETPDEVEYLAYFNVAQCLYRIDP